MAHNLNNSEKYLRILILGIFHKTKVSFPNHDINSRWMVLNVIFHYKSLLLNSFCESIMDIQKKVTAISVKIIRYGRSTLFEPR